jgi:hypothetical protein
MANVNIFEQAAPKVKIEEKRRQATVEVKGVQMLADIDALTDALKGVRAEAESEVKAYMTEVFVMEGHKLHRRPENFHGREGDNAEASLQLRARSPVSALKEMELELAKAHRIPVKEMVEFSFNSKYTDMSDAVNRKLLQRVSDGIRKELGKDFPDDLIQMTQKTVATEESIEAIFKKRDRKDIATLLPLATTLAVRSKLASSTPERLQESFHRAIEALEISPEDKQEEQDALRAALKASVTKPQFKKGGRT